jgi:membrane protease YdiL (CAAX protease family)
MDFNLLALNISEWLGIVAVMMLARLSPRLNIPAVGFRYPRREGMVALFLFALILALNVIFASGRLGEMLAAGLRGGALDVRLELAALSLVPVGLALAVRRQPVRSAGWYQAALGGGLRVGLILVMLTIVLRGKTSALFNGISPAEGRSLALWLGICLAEETIFRGYIQLRLSSWLGERWGLVVTAALFLLWQWPFLSNGPDGLLVTLLLAAVRAVLLGWIAQKSKHVLATVFYRAVSEWLVLLA